MAEQGPALIVGLGNPGPQYQATRHNVGFWFVDALASRYGCTLRAESRFFGEVCRGVFDGEDCRLLKPSTFMNRSGQAVRSLAGFYRIPVQRILVVHDDLDLDVGVVRLKRGGGHGGHNGLRDIIAQMGKDFLRLRIGIGHPGDKHRVHDYVLGKPSPEQRRALEDALHEAEGALPLILAGDIERAMQRLHTQS